MERFRNHIYLSLYPHILVEILGNKDPLKLLVESNGMNKRENIVGSIIRMLYTVLLPLSSQVWYKYYVMLRVWGFIWLPRDIYFYTVYILCAIFCYIHNQEAPYRIAFWLPVSEESQWGWRWSHDGHLVNITKCFLKVAVIINSYCLL